MNKKILIIIVIVFFLGIIIYFVLKGAEKEIYRTTRGEADIIKLFSPEEEETIGSPLIITGRARGTWFFEADFPVLLIDWDGLIIAETFAFTREEWMVNDYVPFEAIINFDSPVFPDADEDHFSRRGYLILQKDNPSDLPEQDDSLEIAIKFK